MSATASSRVCEKHGVAQRDSKAWPRVRLGDIMQRYNVIIHPGDRNDGEAPFVGLEHVEPGTGRRIGVDTVDFSRMTGRKPTFKRGQIVYGYLRPYLNKVWVAEFDGCSSVDQFAFDVNRESAHVEYVAAFLRSEAFLRRSAIVTTTGQLPRISIEAIEAVELDLPPLAEQERIARELTAAMEAAERARRAAQERLAAAEALPAAYLREVFQGPEERTARLDEIADIQLGKMAHPKSRKGVAPFPYLRNANVQWGRFDLRDMSVMDFNDSERDRFSLRPGDLIVCEGGEPGRAAVWEGQVNPCYFQKALFRIRPFEDIADSRFLMYRLWLGAVSGEFRESNATTTIAHLPRVRLCQLILPVPPLSIQRRIVSELSRRLDEAEKLIGRLRDELALIEALPAALLRRAFGGDGAAAGGD